MWWILALAAPPSLSTVDLQQVVSQLPEAKRAGAEVEAARARSQGIIDRRRAALLSGRSSLSEAELAERARAIDAEIDAAERALVALEAQKLDPILRRLEVLLAEVKGQVVLRRDEAAVLGWDERCDLTDWLVSRARGQPAPPPTERCPVTSFRVVDVAALAPGSEAARLAEEKLERRRRAAQAAIDDKRAEVERLEATGTKSQAAHSARRELDDQTVRTRAELERARQTAEREVRAAVERALADAARATPTVAVVDKTDAELPAPAEPGDSWARSALAKVRQEPRGNATGR